MDAIPLQRPVVDGYKRYIESFARIRDKRMPVSIRDVGTLRRPFSGKITENRGLPFLQDRSPGAAEGLWKLEAQIKPSPTRSRL